MNELKMKTNTHTLTHAQKISCIKYDTGTYDLKTSIYVSMK